MNAEKITKYLDELVERGIPSVDCMIYKEHELIYRHMNGKVDSKMTQDVSADTQYLMFSMTKVQTMVAFMQLVEQGKISLEDDVAKYLPTYGKLTVLVDGKEEECKVPMKVKHLLSMQSGLSYDLQRPGIVRVIQEKGMQATTREIIDALPETALNFVPGEHFEYSLSHDVAAAIIEVVSGMSFGEYLRKNIWEPLHMNKTFFAKPMNDDVDNLAAQYEMNDAGECKLMEKSCNYQLTERYESGGAGLISCTEDYAVFGDCIANGGISKDGVRIIGAETIEVIKQNQLGEASLKDIVTNLGRVGYGYGCGMQVLMKPELIGSCAPAGVFGWDGAAGSCLIMDTKSKMALVYTQHVRNCGMAYGEIHPRLRDMMFED